MRDALRHAEFAFLMTLSVAGVIGAVVTLLG